MTEDQLELLLKLDWDYTTQLLIRSVNNEISTFA
jgi:hypothetical protein